MAQRFCHHCGSDVEDTGGFCLLGHRLAVAAPNEVREAPPPPPPPAAEAETAVPAVSSVAPTWAALGTTPGAPPVPDDPINQFAPPARMDWGPGSSVKRFSLKRLRAEVSL
jgi:hypothetical protein